MMNFFDMLQLDPMTIKNEYDKIASVLKKIGFTDYESRAYIALVVENQGTAEEVADIASIPRTSTYKVMQSLIEKGYATASDGRPTIFYPVSPDDIREGVLGEINETFDKLKAMEGMLSERGTPQLVFTISGRERVLAKIGDIIESSMDRLIISSPDIRTIRAEHLERFKEAVKRGVDVTVIAEPFVKVPNATKVYRKPNLLATDVVADGEMALIASPDFSICGYMDNQFITQHLESIMYEVIERLGS
jgi:sugar-specific transcriptional regulator TrmB